eukprot:6656370-Alexandrium_andersonii.AAC.1
MVMLHLPRLGCRARATRPSCCVFVDALVRDLLGWTPCRSADPSRSVHVPWCLNSFCPPHVAGR